MKKKLRLICILLIGTAVLSSCSYLRLGPGRPFFPVHPTVSPMPRKPAEHPVTSAHEADLYTLLSDPAKILYDELAAAFARGEESASLEQINYSEYRDEIDSAMRAFYADHPEYFWLSGGWNAEYVTVEGQVGADSLTVTPNRYSFWEESEQHEEMVAAVNAAVSEITAQTSQLTDDYEKILFVYRYLAEHTEYDHDTAAAVMAEEKQPGFASSPYGCLVQGRAVCGGYAKSFTLILHELGIGCNTVGGTALPGGEGHSWNQVILNGEAYHVDVTWGDSRPITDGELPDGVDYSYFCLNDEEISATHQTDELCFPCNGTDYNYFRYHGFFMDGYDFDRFCEIAQYMAEEPSVAVRFADHGEMDRAKEDLLDNAGWEWVGALVDNPYRTEDAVFYRVDDDLCILTFYFR